MRMCHSCNRAYGFVSAYPVGHETLNESCRVVVVVKVVIVDVVAQVILNELRHMLSAGFFCIMFCQGALVVLHRC